jgi:hypothetical protein
MFATTRVEHFAVAVFVGAGSVIAARSSGGQTIAPSRAATTAQPGARQVHYHIRLIGRDTASGVYTWRGRVDGGVTGNATMELQFPPRPPQIPGTLPLQTRWIVTASPASQSFEANLTGTIDLASRKTHLVGTITGGPWSGQAVESNSQVFNRAPNGALSASDGALTILPQRAPPDTTARP